MTTTTPTSYVVHALPPELLDEVRSRGRDASGSPVERVEATGGEPLRCCLRDALARRAADAVRLPTAYRRRAVP